MVTFWHSGKIPQGVSVRFPNATLVFDGEGALTHFGNDKETGRNAMHLLRIDHVGDEAHLVFRSATPADQPVIIRINGDDS